MLIHGLWYLCDDGIVRPVLKGEIQNAVGEWSKLSFLVDTGADRTVFSADVLGLFGKTSAVPNSKLGGVGGTAATIAIATQIRFDSVDLGKIAFAAFTQLESLDMSVLGRDILNLFALIVDRPRDLVCLLGQRHRYDILQS